MKGVYFQFNIVPVTLQINHKKRHSRNSIYQSENIHQSFTHTIYIYPTNQSFFSSPNRIHHFSALLAHQNSITEIISVCYQFSCRICHEQQGKKTEKNLAKTMSLHHAAMIYIDTSIRRNTIILPFRYFFLHIMRTVGWSIFVWGISDANNNLACSLKRRAHL
jgi:hypothetical protein